MAFFNSAKWSPRWRTQIYQAVEGAATSYSSKSSSRARAAGQKKTSTVEKILYSPLLSLLSLCLIIGNISSHVFVSQKVEFMKHYCPDLPYPPSVTGFRFKVSIMNLGAYNPFGGEVTREVDRAWEGLLDKQFFRASKAEMIHFGELEENSVALEHGGYVAQLRVFRELHCMDWFKRQYGNPEVRATTNFTEHDKDHCLNVLLKGVRCRADTTLSGWFLEDDDIHKPLINRYQAEHVCVEWNSVLDWLRPRALGYSEAVLTKNGKMSRDDMLLRIRAH